MLALPSILAFGRPEVTGVVLLFGFILLTAFVQAGRRPLVPLFAIWGIALLNPALVRELALGSDLFWGPLLVSAGAVLLARGHVIAGGLVFALGLATRLSMVPLLPLWVVAVYMLNGRRQAMAFAATALGALLLMHLPVAVWDPSTYFGYAPLGISAEKVSQQLPEGDNLMADLMAFVLPEGPARPMIVSALMAAGGVLLGLLTRSLPHLLLLSSALLMASLFFVGSYFLLDYLVVCIFPACFAVLLENDGESPLQGARESNARGPAGHDAGISA